MTPTLPDARARVERLRDGDYCGKRPPTDKFHPRVWDRLTAALETPTP